MKKFILNSFLIVVLTTGITNPQAQVIGDMNFLVPDNGFELSGISSGNLIWPEGKRQFVTLNLTQTILPLNTSRIYVDAIVFQFIGKIGGTDTPVDSTSLVPEIILSSTNQTYFLNQTLFPPNTVDAFYLNISMSIGTSFNRVARPHALRFPDEGTILVDRDKLVPLVNLYGFPPSSFFAKLLPVYFAIILIMIIPGVYYSINKFTRRGQKLPTTQTIEGDDAHE